MSLKATNSIASGESRRTRIKENPVAEGDELECYGAEARQIIRSHNFSTKHRADLILPEIEEELFSYIGGIANNNKSKLLAANGTKNHVHLLVSMSKNIELSKLVGDIKRDSSKWIKTKGVSYRNFGWQDRLRRVFGRLYAD